MRRVTVKDWVKIRKLIDLHGWPVPVLVPELELEVFAGEDRLWAAVETRLAATGSSHG